MTDARIIAILESIDASLKAILALRKPASPRVDLDSEHGDPLVRAKDPKDWTGEPMKGRRFSECPPAYLDLLAERFDYFATKEADAKKLAYTKLDAARARGWAERLRAGWTPPVSAGEPTW